MKSKKLLIFSLLFAGILSNRITYAQDWNTAGNTGTNPTSDFIGTTDNVGLIFRTNNNPVATFDVNGRLGIGNTNPQDLLHINSTSSVYQRFTNNNAPNGFQIGLASTNNVQMIANDRNRRISFYTQILWALQESGLPLIVQVILEYATTLHPDMILTLATCSIFIVTTMQLHLCNSPILMTIPPQVPDTLLIVV